MCDTDLTVLKGGWVMEKTVIFEARHKCTYIYKRLHSVTFISFIDTLFTELKTLEALH